MLTFVSTYIMYVLDLHQPELQVEPTVTRNVQEGESESIKRISCEGTLCQWNP